MGGTHNGAGSVSTSRSIPLTLKFEIKADCDFVSGFEVELVSVEPRAVFHPGVKAPTNEGSLLDGIFAQRADGEKRCLNCEYQDEEERAERKCAVRSYYLCDACAVEDAIVNIGAEHWLTELAAVELKREGRLEIVGHNIWNVYDTMDGTDYDEEFEVNESKWERAA